MEVKMYTIAEIAEVLNVSKVTVYNKLKQLEDKVNLDLTVKEGVKYLNENGFNLIKESLKEKPILKKETQIIDMSIVLGLKDENINLLKMQIDDLKSQLHEKDKQLEVKDRLIENMQFLLKDSQKNILLLQSEKKGFWAKIFNKKKNSEN